MLCDRERLTRILYYGDISPDSKQFIQNLVDEKDKKILNLIGVIGKTTNYIKNNNIDNPIKFKKELLNILSGGDE